MHMFNGNYSDQRGSCGQHMYHAWGTYNAYKTEIGNLETDTPLGRASSNLGDNLTTLYVTRLYGAKLINWEGFGRKRSWDLAAITEENLKKPQS